MSGSWLTWAQWELLCYYFKLAPLGWALSDNWPWNPPRLKSTGAPLSGFGDAFHEEVLTASSPASWILWTTCDVHPMSMGYSCKNLPLLALHYIPTEQELLAMPWALLEIESLTDPELPIPSCPVFLESWKPHPASVVLRTSC